MAILAACLDIPSFLVRTNTHKNTWLTTDFDWAHAIDAKPPLNTDEIDHRIDSFRFGEISDSANEIGLRFSQGVGEAFSQVLHLNESKQIERKDIQQIKDADFISAIRHDSRKEIASAALHAIKRIPRLGSFDAR